jgi:hypothetical protein
MKAYGMVYHKGCGILIGVVAYCHVDDPTGGKCDVAQVQEMSVKSGLLLLCTKNRTLDEV